MKTEQINSMTIKLVSIELSKDQRRGPDATGICKLPSDVEKAFTVHSNYNDKAQPRISIEGTDRENIKTMLGITLDTEEIRMAYIKLMADKEASDLVKARLAKEKEWSNHPLHTFVKNYEGWELSKTKKEFIEQNSTWLHAEKTIEYKNKSMVARIEWDEYNHRGQFELTINNHREKRSKKITNIIKAYDAAKLAFEVGIDSDIREKELKEANKNELATVLEMDVVNVNEYRSSSMRGRRGYTVSRNKIMIKKGKETYNDKYVTFNKGREPNTISVDSWHTGDITIEQFKAIVNILKGK